MGKITITFAEEGQSPSSIEIPAEITVILDAHVAQMEAEGQRVVGGKTGLFARMTWENWLRPILARHGHDTIALAGEAGQAAVAARQQAQQAEAAAEMAAMAAVIQVLPQRSENAEAQP